MSIKIMSMVWDDNSGILSGIEKAVLLKLADYSADNGTQIFPSLNTLCRCTSFSMSTVVRTLASLETKKYIKKTNRQKSIHTITNLYRIQIETLRRGGTVRETGGVLSERQGGTVRENNNTSLEPSHRNINNKPQKIIDKKEPIFKPQNPVVVISLTKYLKDNNVFINQKTLDCWIKIYGEKKILEAVEVMKITKGIRNAPAWLRSCLLEGYELPNGVTQREAKINVSETKNFISKMKETEECVERQKEEQIKRHGRLIGLKERLAMSQK